MKKRSGGRAVVTAPSGSRKRAASEAAAHVTYEEISSLFGLSLAQAAARIGVRTPLSTPHFPTSLLSHFPLCAAVLVGWWCGLEEEGPQQAVAPGSIRF
eukprot:COSAG02_NODE_12309_length_1564_cov_47.722867_1_plen_99_part_00